GQASELRRVRLRGRGRGDPPPARCSLGGPGRPARRRDAACDDGRPPCRFRASSDLREARGSTSMTATTHDARMPQAEGDLTVEVHGMEPIPENARYGSLNRVFTVWFTPNLRPAAFFVGTLAALSIVGYEAIHTFERFAAIGLAILFAIVTIAVLPKANFGLANGDAAGIGTFILMTTIAGSFNLAWALYASDYTRYLPRDAS